MKRICAIFLGLLFIFGICGCSSSDETDESDKEQTPIEKTAETINNFETYEDLQRIVYSGTGGKIRLNTDQKYIKSGNASMFVEIEGLPMNGANFYPTMTFHTNAGMYEKMDFTDVKSIDFDVYNVGEADTEIGFKLIDAYWINNEQINCDVYNPTQPGQVNNHFPLKKGEWTHISFKLCHNPEHAHNQFDNEDPQITKYRIDKIMYFDLYFKNRLSEDEPIRNLYIDDMRFVFEGK